MFKYIGIYNFKLLLECGMTSSKHIVQQLVNIILEFLDCL